MTVSGIDHVGVIGLGQIGGALVDCLRSSAIQVTAHDIAQPARDEAAARGARLVASPAAVAAAADVVFTALSSEAASDSVVRGPSGILAGARSGAVIVDVSTRAPDAVRAAAAACRNRGVWLLDAPVSGRPPDMTVFLGGDPEPISRVEPLLATMASEVHRLGPVGNGAVAKLASQYALLMNLVSALDATRLAAAGGVDPAAFLPALKSGHGGSRAQALVSRFVAAGSFAGNGGPLRVMQKDIALADALWNGQPTPQRWTEVRDLFARTAEQHGVEADFWAVALELERDQPAPWFGV